MILLIGAGLLLRIRPAGNSRGAHAVVSPAAGKAATTSSAAPLTTESPVASAPGATTAPSATTQSASSDAILFPFDGTIQDNGLPKPWESRVIVGKLKSEIIKEASGGQALRITCDQSHFVVWCKTTPVDPDKFPIIAWWWLAENLPPQGDSRTHKALPLLPGNHNDKGLQLMVGFEKDFVLNYVWDSNAPVGYELDEVSPVATIKSLVVDSGSPTKEKREHLIDVRADYIRRFGKPPGKILGIGISANTNHTSSFSQGTIGGIRLLPAKDK